MQLGYQRWVEPFAIVPHWTMRGVADNGSFFDGGRTICGGGGIAGRCVRINWQFGWSAYGQPTYRAPSWQGALLEDKRDGTGLTFRRNRYVDSNSGRFTQEDPIGLAGGLNLFGFAEGDPVNFADPFGLCPFTDSDESCYQLLANWGARTGRNWALNLGAGLAAGSAVLEAVGSALGMGGGCGEYTCGTPILAFPGSAPLRASPSAHAAQEEAAAAGRSWTTQRRTFWRTEAASEGAAQRWGEANVSRMRMGNAPQIDGRPVELHHTPVPQRAGGMQVRPVTPEQHAQQDPFRRLGNP